MQLQDLGAVELKLEDWVPQISELRYSRALFTVT